MLTEKDYCDYDTCVALKELGYPTKMTFVNEFGSIEIPINSGLIHLYDAQKWLRENHGIHIIIDRFGKDYNWFIKKKGSMVYDYESADFEDYIDYEGALLAGIKIAIKILKEERG